MQGTERGGDMQQWASTAKKHSAFICGTHFTSSATGAPRSAENWSTVSGFIMYIKSFGNIF